MNNLLHSKALLQIFVPKSSSHTRLCNSTEFDKLAHILRHQKQRQSWQKPIQRPIFLLFFSGKAVQRYSAKKKKKNKESILENFSTKIVHVRSLFAIKIFDGVPGKRS